MRLMHTKFLAAALLPASSAFAQTINPTGGADVRWTGIVSSGLPTSPACTSAIYGTPFQDQSVTPNKWGSCGSDGWQYRGTVGSGSTLAAPNAYASGTAYPTIGTLVSNSGYNYISTQAVPAGQAPSGSNTSNSYWAPFSLSAGALVSVTQDLTIAANGAATVNSYGGGNAFGTAAGKNIAFFAQSPATSCSAGQYTSISATGVVTCSTPTSSGGGANTPATTGLLKGNGTANGVVAAAPTDLVALSAQAMQLNSQQCTALGDSITQGTPATGVATGYSVEQAIQLYSSRCPNVINLGVAGQTSTHIASRFGAYNGVQLTAGTYAQTLTVTGGVIPVSGVATVTMTGGYDPTYSASGSSVYPVPATLCTTSISPSYVAGIAQAGSACTGLVGTLYYSASTITFTLASPPAAAITVSGAIPFFVERKGVAGGFVSILMGTNNITQGGGVAQIEQDLTYLINNALPADPTTGLKRFVISTVPTNNLSGNWNSGGSYASFTALKSWVLTNYPNSSFDLWGALVAAYDPTNPEDVIDASPAVSFTGTTTSGSNSVTAVSGGAPLLGTAVSGTGIAAGATVAGFSGSTLTLSANATASGTAVALVSQGHNTIPASLRLTSVGTLITPITDTTSCPALNGQLSSVYNYTGTFGSGVGATVLVSGEKIYYSAATTCTRGYAGTTAVAHVAGEPLTIIDSTHLNAWAQTIWGKGVVAVAEGGADPGAPVAVAVVAGNASTNNSPGKIGSFAPGDAAFAHVVLGAATGYTNTPSNLGTVYVKNQGSGYTAVPAVTCTGTVGKLPGVTIGSIVNGGISGPVITFPGFPTVTPIQCTVAAPPSGVTATLGLSYNTPNVYDNGITFEAASSPNGGHYIFGYSSYNWCGNRMDSCITVYPGSNSISEFGPSAGSGFHYFNAGMSTAWQSNDGLNQVYFKNAGVGSNSSNAAASLSAQDFSFTGSNSTIGTPPYSATPIPIGNITTKGFSPVCSFGTSGTLTSFTTVCNDINASTTSPTITLPVESALNNNLFCFTSRNMAGGNTVTISGNGSVMYVNGTTAGQSTIVLTSPNQLVCLNSRASNYWMQEGGDYQFPTATTSIGGTSLAAGACATATVSKPGVLATDTLVTTPQTFPGAGFTWNAYVSAANTVTEQVCNISAAAATPTASVYNVRQIH